MTKVKILLEQVQEGWVATASDEVGTLATASSAFSGGAVTEVKRRLRGKVKDPDFEIVRMTPNRGPKGGE